MSNQPIRAMCQNPTCPVRGTCQRHTEAGATPNSHAQSWLIEQRYGGQGCDFYSPVEEEARAA